MRPVEFIVAGFDSYQRAEQVLDELRAMDREDTLSILNAVVIKKDAEGRVTASEDGDVRPGSGALFGALVGAVVGFLGGPGGAVVGAAAGAITGGITAAGIDMGFSDQAVQEMKDSLPPGCSAILALVEHEWVEKLTAEIAARRGRIIRHTLRTETLRQLRKERNKD